MSDATSPIDPEIAARFAALETVIAAQRAELDARAAALAEERALRTDAEAERDRAPPPRDDTGLADRSGVTA